MHRPLVVGLLAVAAFTVLVPIAGEATISIQPAFIELQLDRGRPSETINVTNLTDQEARYRIQVHHFIFTPKGGIQTVEPDEHSLAPWTKLNPREFTLPPKGTRIIRLSVIPPPNLRPGEYWGTIELEPLEGIKSETESPDGQKLNLEVITSVLVPIMGRVGEVHYGLDLKDLSAWRTDEGISIRAHLINTGTARIRPKGEYELLGPSGEVVTDGLIGEDTILMGGERIFTRDLPGDFPEGDYLVRVRYSSRRIEETVAGQTRVASEIPVGLDTENLH